MKWLGRQLDYQRAEDWSRLRAYDLRHHHGAGLLKEIKGKVRPIVTEYLNSNKRKPVKG